MEKDNKVAPNFQRERKHKRLLLPTKMKGKGLDLTYPRETIFFKE